MLNRSSRPNPDMRAAARHMPWRCSVSSMCTVMLPTMATAMSVYSTECSM